MAKKKKTGKFSFRVLVSFSAKNGDREKNFQRNEKEEEITGVHFPDWEIFELASTSILGEKINSPLSPFFQKNVMEESVQKDSWKNFLSWYIRYFCEGEK